MDISAKDRIIIRDLKTINSDLSRLIEEGEKNLGKSSPALSHLELDLVVKKLQLLLSYSRGLLII